MSFSWDLGDRKEENLWVVNVDRIVGRGRNVILGTVLQRGGMLKLLMNRAESTSISRDWLSPPVFELSVTGHRDTDKIKLDALQI